MNINTATNTERLSMPFLSERIANLTEHSELVLSAFRLASRLRDALAYWDEQKNSQSARERAHADAIAIYHRLEEMKDFDFVLEWRKVGAIRCPQCEC